VTIALPMFTWSPTLGTGGVCSLRQVTKWADRRSTCDLSRAYPEHNLLLLPWGENANQSPIMI